VSLLPGTVRSVAPTLCASAIKGLCSSIGSAILPLAKTQSGGWRSEWPEAAKRADGCFEADGRAATVRGLAGESRA
jgi:hypothetical protein